MEVTHTISVKSNGREVGIIFIEAGGSRISVEAVDTANDRTDEDRRICNAIMYGLDIRLINREQK